MNIFNLRNTLCCWQAVACIKIFMMCPIQILSSIKINPSPALTYQNVLDLNVACRAKRTQTYWHVRTFKCPLKKTQPSCPGSRDLNWTGKGLKYLKKIKHFKPKCLVYVSAASWTQIKLANKFPTAMAHGIYYNCTNNRHTLATGVSIKTHQNIFFLAFINLAFLWSTKLDFELVIIKTIGTVLNDSWQYSISNNNSNL
jgi:hypothetical protein